MVERKMKKKEANFIIPYVVYPFDVMVSINQTDDQLIKAVKRFGLGKDDIEPCLDLPKTNRGRTVILGTNQTILRITDAPDADIHSTIAHEVFHAVTFLFYKLEMKLVVTENDEAYAYLIGYLTKEIYKGIRKHIK